MSSRPWAFLFGAFLVGTASAAGAACSSGDEKASVATDAGIDAAPEANRAPPPEPEASTPKTCLERCADAHPSAVAKDQAIDTCWEAHCASPCINGDLTPSDDAGTDAGADGGACVSPVVTPSSSCDQCTTASCCDAWDGCFQDPECSALEDCYSQCE